MFEKGVCLVERLAKVAAVITNLVLTFYIGIGLFHLSKLGLEVIHAVLEKNAFTMDRK